MRVMIVDDEPLARLRLRMLLAEQRDVEIAGEAETVDEALPMLQRLRPDLLLLDVVMPRQNGFELLSKLEAELPPVVIFTTAHSDFAVEAFGAGATDYLVKPFGRERLTAAMERARRALASTFREEEEGESTPGLLSDRFPVRLRREIVFVRTSELTWIAAEGNYVRLHTRHGSHLVRDQLKNVEDRLDPKKFLRVHRSAIVNVDVIVKLIAEADGSYSILLEGGATVPLGPNFRRRFETATGAKL